MVFFLDKGEGNHVDVGHEDSSQLTFPSIDLSRNCTVYADQFHPIAWSESIHIVVVC